MSGLENTTHGAGESVVKPTDRGYDSLTDFLFDAGSFDRGRLNGRKGPAGQIKVPHAQIARDILNNLSFTQASDHDHQARA
ncbi:MAG: hypothetical protein ABR963_05090 [Acidimicrobiales bacterium]|jgi:hypothetical protein